MKRGIVYLGPCKTSLLELFGKIVNGSERLFISAKKASS